MLGQLHIRPATADDAELIAAIAEKTFRDTFTTESSAQDVDDYARDSFELSRIQAELADSANSFLLASVDEATAPIGYAKLRTGTSEPSVTGSNPVELERLYVDKTMIGKGFGAALMQASLDMARDRGYQTIWLGVWEENERAIAFYKRWAFQQVGTHIFRLGTDDQTDFILTRSVPGVTQAT